MQERLPGVPCVETHLPDCLGLGDERFSRGVSKVVQLVYHGSESVQFALEVLAGRASEPFLVILVNLGHAYGLQPVTLGIYLLLEGGDHSEAAAGTFLGFKPLFNGLRETAEGLELVVRLGGGCHDGEGVVNPLEAGGSLGTPYRRKLDPRGA